jgi:hypothetical protein
MAYEVVPDELRTHAKHLDALTDRLHTAVDAAKTVVMDDSAYGLLCAFLPPIINKTTQDDATEALDSAVEGMTSTADNVKTAAQSYEDTDTANAEPFKKGLAQDLGADGSDIQGKLRPREGVARTDRTAAHETTAPNSDGTVNETLQRMATPPNEAPQHRMATPQEPQPDGTVNETLQRMATPPNQTPQHRMATPQEPQSDGTVNETLQRIGSLPTEQHQPTFMEKGVTPQYTEGVPASERLVDRLSEGTEQ